MKKMLLGLAVAAALGLLAAGITRAAASFADPAGDSGAAPDITAVAVSNDVAGNVTFSVTVANQPTLAADAVLLLVIDSDDNATTGDSDGFDYGFVTTGASPGYVLLHWDGSNYVEAPTTTVHMSYSGGVATIAINKSELANTSKFAFGVLGAEVSGGQIIASDGAPDSSAWEYTLTTPPPPPPPPKPLALSAGKPAAKPLHPKAGLAFVVSVPVKRTDTGAPLTSGQVTCTVTVGGKPVRAAGRIVGGKAQCVVRVPKATKGKMLRGSMAIVFKTAGATKTFAFKVT